VSDTGTTPLDVSDDKDELANVRGSVLPEGLVGSCIG
jgi:hypothetical protein